jgi:hypothetical protein
MVGMKGLRLKVGVIILTKGCALVGFFLPMFSFLVLVFGSGFWFLVLVSGFWFLYCLGVLFLYEFSFFSCFVFENQKSKNDISLGTFLVSVC